MLKKIVVIYILLFSSQSIWAQSDYEMPDSRLVLAIDSKVFFKKLGYVPGINLRYSFKNLNGDENCLGLSYYNTKKFVDPIHLQAKAVGTSPQTIDTSVSYNSNFLSLMYHYHYYIQQTQYGDDYGFYIAGAAGIIKSNYTHLYNIESNRYNTTYPYRQSKVGMSLQAAYGAHYQIWTGYRLFGEAGFYYFYDKQSKVYNEGPHYVAFQVTLGFVMGLGAKGNGL